MIDFYEDGLAQLGVLCERTWHDRLEVIADGDSAKLWNHEGSFHADSLQFLPADGAGFIDPMKQVFPGCPLTFKIAEALRPEPLLLEKIILSLEGSPQPPDLAVAEKLWRQQHPHASRVRIRPPFKLDFHFSLVALARCEIQAIDQHWSLHRVAISLGSGEPDESLARDLLLLPSQTKASLSPTWPVCQWPTWNRWLQRALEFELAPNLELLQTRQRKGLTRELHRIDDYFENYAIELQNRAGRSKDVASQLKVSDRLAAAKAEHSRKRADQVERYAINISTYLDALVLVAEPAWRASLEIDGDRQAKSLEGLLVPRDRRWEAL